MRSQKYSPFLNTYTQAYYDTIVSACPYAPTLYPLSKQNTTDARNYHTGSQLAPHHHAALAFLLPPRDGCLPHHYL